MRNIQRGWVACWVKCKCCFLPHPYSKSHTDTLLLHSCVTGNYSMRVTVSCGRLGGQACCLLPVGHRASPLWLHPQSAPLAPRPAVFPPVVCFVPAVSWLFYVQPVSFVTVLNCLCCMSSDVKWQWRDSKITTQHWPFLPLNSNLHTASRHQWLSGRLWGERVNWLCSFLYEALKKGTFLTKWMLA